MDDPKAVKISVFLSTDLHRRAKAAAALEGVSLYELVADMLARKLAPKNPKPGKPQAA